MSKELTLSAKIWPWAIVVSILMIIAASILTIIKALELPVQESEIYMRNYHDTMENVNDIIEAQIAFDKKYVLSFETKQITKENMILKYKLVAKGSQEAVNNADIIVRVTTPYDHESDVDLTKPTISEGMYSFASIDLPKEGRWDIMAKVSVEDNYRYYNLKADTRYPQTTEY